MSVFLPHFSVSLLYLSTLSIYLSIYPQALKIAFTDKTPEVKGGLALCLMSLIRGAEDFASVPLDSLLTLGLKVSK